MMGNDSDKNIVKKRLDVEPIKARCNAAEEGPWFIDSDRVFAGVHAGGAFVAETYNSARAGRSGANAMFIACARDDVPALVAEVEALRAGIQAFYSAWGPRLPDAWRDHFDELLGKESFFGMVDLDRINRKAAEKAAAEAKKK